MQSRLTSCERCFPLTLVLSPEGRGDRKRKKEVSSPLGERDRVRGSLIENSHLRDFHI
jgi:hypothetical protein